MVGRREISLILGMSHYTIMRRCGFDPLPFAPTHQRMEKPMKITLIEINDFKRLRTVTIEPGERNLILIAGKNTQGKSSLLGAMDAALGGKKEVPEQPIRHGATGASIRMVFDDGALIVRRKFTPKGTSIEVTSDGMVVKSPQKMLDLLRGARFIDPMEFSRLPAKQKREVMLGCVELSIDLDKNIEAERVSYNLRRDTNRDIKKLESKVSIAPAKPLADVEDPAVLQENLNEMHRMRSKGIEATSEIGLLDQKLETAKRKKKLCQEALAKARNELKEASDYLELEIDSADSKFDELRTIIDKVPIQEEIDAAQLKILNFMETGDAAAKYKAWEGECKELEALRKESDKHSRAIKTIQDGRTQALEDAEMPIPGLSFGEDGLQLNGAPFEQASGAERLRASIAIAWALKPELQDIWVQDGALLDEDSLAIVKKFAEDNGLCVWLERVGESDEEAIIMVDGEVKTG